MSDKAVFKEYDAKRYGQGEWWQYYSFEPFTRILDNFKEEDENPATEPEVKRIQTLRYPYKRGYSSVHVTKDFRQESLKIQESTYHCGGLQSLCKVGAQVVNGIMQSRVEVNRSFVEENKSVSVPSFRERQEVPTASTVIGDNKMPAQNTYRGAHYTYVH